MIEQSPTARIWHENLAAITANERCRFCFGDRLKELRQP
jgi:hypothetical protein